MIQVIEGDECVILYYPDRRDGLGWYYYSEEHPEAGSSGPFKTRDEAANHALVVGGYAKATYK